MGEEKECSLFRKPEGLGFGKGVGYCDMDGSSANCDGDAKFCEKPDALRQYLQRELDKFKKKESKSWMLSKEVIGDKIDQDPSLRP